MVTISSFTVAGAGLPACDCALRGPIVWTRDTQLPDTNLGKVITPVKGANGFIQLTSTGTDKRNTWMV